MPQRRIGFPWVIALACAFAGHAFAQADDASVPWTDGPVEGVSIGDWTAQWWRWAQGARVGANYGATGEVIRNDGAELQIRAGCGWDAEHHLSGDRNG